MSSRRLTALALALLLGGPSAATAAHRDLDRTTRHPVTDGTRLVVDVGRLDVTLRSGDVRQVEVSTELRISGVGEEKAAEWIERHTPEVSTDAGRLVVSARPGRDGFLGLGLLTARARLKLLAPPGVSPDLTTVNGDILVHGDFPTASPLRLRTANGQMEMIGATASLDIRTASGDSRIELIRPAEELFARTSSGSVSVSGGARTTHVDTSSGDVWLSNLSGSAEVETATGDVTLRWDRLDPDCTVSVRSTSGRVRLTIPDHVRPQGRLTTTGGTIRSDFPGVVNDAGDAVELTGDGPTLLVETASGEIVLTTGEP